MMQNANHVLDNFAESVMAAPAGVSVMCPWNRQAYDDDAQAAAATLIRLGVLGATQDVSSGKIRLYLGRQHAGNPAMRLLNVWLVCIIASLFLYGLYYLHGHDHASANWAGLTLGILGGSYFWTHGLAAWKHSWLFAFGMGRSAHFGEFSRLGVNFVSGLVGFASAAGFASRLFG
jgi:hypothetical protein